MFFLPHFLKLFYYQSGWGPLPAAPAHVTSTTNETGSLPAEMHGSGPKSRRGGGASLGIRARQAITLSRSWFMGGICCGIHHQRGLKSVALGRPHAGSERQAEGATARPASTSCWSISAPVALEPDAGPRGRDGPCRSRVPLRGARSACQVSGVLLSLRKARCGGGSCRLGGCRSRRDHERRLRHGAPSRSSAHSLRKGRESDPVSTGCSS